MSEKVKITITEALRERKLLKARIERAIIQAKPFGLVLGDAQKPEQRIYQTSEALVVTCKASVQSVLDMLERYDNLVSEIIKSNASTVVTVAGIEMKVAEAVERRDSMKRREAFVNHIESSLANFATKVGILEREMDAKINKQVADTKTEAMDADEIKALTEETTARVKKVSEPKLLDPCDMQGKLVLMKGNVTAFFDELETKLNVSNALTTIEI